MVWLWTFELWIDFAAKITTENLENQLEFIWEHF